MELVSTPAGPPPERLSPSGADTYRQCPRRWELRYIHRLPDPPGEAALAGTFAHRVLERLLQEPSEARTIERAKVIAREVWPETESDSDFAALELDDEGSRQFRWKGWTAVEGLWKLEDPTLVDVAATEQDIKTELAGVPFRGIVDRLDAERDGVVVSDYKSGRAPSPRFTAARLTQVLLYAAAVAAATGSAPVRARLLYLGQKVVQVDVTDEKLDAATGELKETWDALRADCETGAFEPSPGPLCGWCPYADRCPEGEAEIRRRREQGVLNESAPGALLFPAAS